MSDKYWKGAGVILHYNDGTKNYALVGKETRYLSDFSVPIEINKYERKEKENQTYEEMCKYYSDKAKELSKIKLFEKEMYISYDRPYIKNNEWKVNMRVVKHENDKENYGMPKGGKDDRDKDPKDTAIRELEEEVGVKMDKSRLNFLEVERHYHFYQVKINEEEVKKIKEMIEKMREENVGEMHDLQFMEIGEIRKNINKFNGLGRKVFGGFVNKFN